MALTKPAGLTPQEAFEQVLAEEEAAASTSPSSAEEKLEPLDNSGIEQSAVETEEEVGLFSDLDSDGGQITDEGLHEVKVNGETSKVTLHELVDGYQRQADYTRGKQELAAKEKEYEKAITLWNALEEDYVKTVQALMSRAGLQGQVAQKPAQDLDAIVEAKLQEKFSSDPRIQAFEQEQSLRQIEAIFVQVEDEFDVKLSDSDKQLVLERAQAEQNFDLRYITWMMLQEVERKNAQKRNVELASSMPGIRSGQVEEVETQPERFNSPSAAWAAALAEENTIS